ncbi:MAG: hypothetical protein VR64_02480 [Desulfatitalea sp. BRH_c12]|nr:MAG: hypothetical protein VR64_02480 [Desulfatitalea sp. BRH_c12]
MCPFVRDFIPTPSGNVPLIQTALAFRDRLGTIGVRLGLGRSNYKVAPGLYAVGHPDDSAEVLVTANYKLSFDHLRQSLQDIDAWLLVLDTRGINVWCAAGKGTFGTEELVRRIRHTGLSQVVSHRRLILPQLGATGVSALKVKKACGFEVVWGPVRATDLKRFLFAGRSCDASMRRVTFTLVERLVLVPVEITLLGKHLIGALLLIAVLSGIGPHVFSLAAAWQRGIWATAAVVAGIAAGCLLVPALLPWLPARSFALKGLLAGSAVAAVLTIGQWKAPMLTAGAMLSLGMMTVAVSSFLAMNFTGSTPFTSPSGVEKEMRRYIPLQAGAIFVALVLWIASAFF